MNGGEKIVLLMIQDIVVDGNTGRDQLCDAPFHQLLRQLRVFQLVADSHTLTGTYQLRQIAVQGVVRETCHLDGLPRAVRLLGLHNT